MTVLFGSANLDKIVQENTLARYIGDALFPALLYRAAAKREKWEAAAGQTMTFTNPGLMEPDTTPRTPGVTPAFRTLDYEHYLATMNLHGFPTTVHMPSNYVTITPTFWQQAQKLGLAAAQTMNRLARNRLFLNYLAGHAIAEVVAGGGVTITVNTLNGFITSIDPTTGFPVTVSTAAPRAFSVNGVLVAQLIIGAVPNDVNNPNGPGILTLSATAGIAPGDLIDATDASQVIRPNNSPSVDGITAGDILTMRHIRQAITGLRRDNVGPCEDGYYHVHFDPIGESHLFLDNAVQRQIQNRGLEDDPYLKFALGAAQGAVYFSNNESPAEDTVAAGTLTPAGVVRTVALTSGAIGADVINEGGIPILRTIVIGGGALHEKYTPETAYMSEAGVQGKIGGFSVINGGVEIPMDGIRFIMKAPSDVFNEIVNLAWSWTGDFVTPTNRLTGRSDSAYKRARVIETSGIE